MIFSCSMELFAVKAVNYRTGAWLQPGTYISMMQSTEILNFQLINDTSLRVLHIGASHSWAYFSWKYHLGQMWSSEPHVTILISTPQVESISADFSSPAPPSNTNSQVLNLVNPLKNPRTPLTFNQELLIDI